MSRKLLFPITRKDFHMEFYVGGGRGGQNRNKVATCVRITHLASGAVGDACEQRTQYQNRKAAFQRLVESRKFQQWHKVEASARLLGYADTEKMVDEMLRPEHLTIEVMTDSGWQKTVDVQGVNTK